MSSRDSGGWMWLWATIGVGGSFADKEKRLNHREHRGHREEKMREEGFGIWDLGFQIDVGREIFG